MNREEASETIHLYFEAWVEQNVEKFARVIHEDAIVRECTGAVIEGGDELRRWFKEWNEEGNRVVHWTVHSIGYDEELLSAFAEWTFKCVYDGAEYEWDGASRMRFRDSLIIELNEYEMKREKFRPYSRAVQKGACVMGAWGTGIFENDEVMDWKEELLRSAGIEVLEEAIQNALDEEEIESHTASIALAAIDILAALNGKPGDEVTAAFGYIDGLEDWVKQRGGTGMNLQDRAKQAIDRILAESELKELWEETEEYREWEQTVLDLGKRI